MDVRLFIIISKSTSTSTVLYFTLTLPSFIFGKTISKRLVQKIRDLVPKNPENQLGFCELVWVKIRIFFYCSPSMYFIVHLIVFFCIVKDHIRIKQLAILLFFSQCMSISHTIMIPSLEYVSYNLRYKGVNVRQTQSLQHIGHLGCQNHLPVQFYRFSRE